MNILEKEIEDLVFDALIKRPELLKSRGLGLWDNMKYRRQVNLGEYGRADIIGYSLGTKKNAWRSVYAHVFEIKKDEINLGTLRQAVRYCRAIQRLCNTYLTDYYLHLRICLIGKSIDKSDFVYFPEVFEIIQCYTYELDLEKGLSFVPHIGYKLTDEQLPDMSFLLNEIRLSNRFGEPEELPF